jgi:cytosine/adenosine deaminase-related metal-dependent hydrolase
MVYHKLRGDQLFDGNFLFDSSKVLVCNNQNHFINLIHLEDAGEDVQYIPGLITPGLVNAHCHLELSHLKDVIPPHTKLIPFLVDVVQKRGFSDEIIQSAIAAALMEMELDGIVAVGDISNTKHTAIPKANHPIQFHNFIEVLSFTDARAKENLAQYQSVLSFFQEQNAGNAVLTAHAPYSISPASFQMINAATEGKTISVHNQETPAEDILFQSGGGDFLQFFKLFGMDVSPFPVTGKSSIRSWLPYFTGGQKILLIHNTFMQEEDIQWANEYAKVQGLELVYCFCVNANLYIENTLPPLDIFMRNNCTIVLGTDSYSSNWSLKISEELKTIHHYYPNIPIEMMLQWATVNGAKALGLQTPWISGSSVMEKLK